MLHLQKYVSPADLEEAWQLNQQSDNVLLGGTGWLKLMDTEYDTGIDLSCLGLDKITETDAAFEIGAMVTLRALETHAGIAALTHGMMAESLKRVVGTQFRNCATVGGTVWSRFGFSDLITLLMVMDCDVRLYKGGTVSLSEFMTMKQDRDILVSVILKKSSPAVSYMAFRNIEMDFPVLAVAAAKTENGFRCAVGARPGRAVLLEGASCRELEEKAGELSYGGNTRATAEYRKHLAGVLIGRNLKALEG